MLAEFTKGERNFALSLATLVALAGLFFALAGQDVLIQTHGAMAAAAAALALLYLVITYSAPEPAAGRMERYYDGPTKVGVVLAMIFAVVGFLVGDWVAWLLYNPNLTFDAGWASFGRIRPLHTSAVIFGFGGNALIATFWLRASACRSMRPDWALTAAPAEHGEATVTLACNGAPMASFSFDDALRRGTRETVATLRDAGLDMEILSGDATPAVRRIAEELRVPFAARLRPDDKVARLQALQSSGHKVLMVGDGLNDTAALVAAHASMAPATAADVGRNAADFVFLRDDLRAVTQAVAIAKDAATLVRQNLAIAVAYNVVAVPAAIFGMVTPLVAAIAMSASSLVVVANALRLRGTPRSVTRNPVSPPVLQAAE